MLWPMPDRVAAWPDHSNPSTGNRMGKSKCGLPDNAVERSSSRHPPTSWIGRGLASPKTMATVLSTLRMYKLRISPIVSTALPRLDEAEGIYLALACNQSAIAFANAARFLGVRLEMR